MNTDAGWNLFPLPAVINNWLGRTSMLSRLSTAAMAGAVYGGMAWEMNGLIRKCRRP